MIVVMKVGHSKRELDGVIARITEAGFKANLSQGVERTVVGVVGQPQPDLKEDLGILDGVEEVIPITKPYKLASRDFQPTDTVIHVGGVTIGGNEVVVMAGPCAVESEEQVLSTARAVKAAGAVVLRGGAYKPSSSPYTFRGLGEDGLKLLALAGKETGLPIITEVMTPGDVDLVCRYSDILQIGARNVQNYYLLDEVGRCRKPVMLKRGFATTYQEWLLCAEYILAQGNNQLMLCERGIRTFETHTRNTLDVNAFPSIKSLSHLPVLSDPSHGTGLWRLVTPGALASVAAGADGIMVEVHPHPERALKDGAQSLTFENFEVLMQRLAKVADAVGRPLAKATARVTQSQGKRA